MMSDCPELDELIPTIDEHGLVVSILKKHGIENAININGGFKSIKESTLALSEEVCPSTLA